MPWSERGANGDGGPATAARLTLSAGIAVDAAGDLVISDTVASHIRKWQPADAPDQRRDCMAAAPAVSSRRPLATAESVRLPALSRVRQRRATACAESGLGKYDSIDRVHVEKFPYL